MQEKLRSDESAGATLERNAGILDVLMARGHFEVECVGKDGKVKWRDQIKNLVTTAGKNKLLDKFFRGYFPTILVDFNNLSVTGDHAYGAVNVDQSGMSPMVQMDSGNPLANSAVQFTDNGGAMLYIGVNDSPTKQAVINKLVALAPTAITDLGGLRIIVVCPDYARFRMTTAFVGGTGDAMTGSELKTQKIYMGLKGSGTALAADTQPSHTWFEVGLAHPPTYSGNRPAITMNAPSAGSISSPVTSFAMTGAGTVAGVFMNFDGLATKDDTTGTLYSAGDFSGGSKTVAASDTLNVTYTASV